MKISVITSVLNCAEFIEQNLKSVISQTYRNVEHIIVDGGSTDGTFDIVKKYPVAFAVSERDNGIYHGMNKGIIHSTGDIIGFLNGDDFYNDERVLEDVVNKMKTGLDSCYGDIVYVSRENPNRIVRYWRSGEYKAGMFKKGWMPPHPAFFVRREVFLKFGVFNTRLKISADYEFMLRVLERGKISTGYLPRILVRMRTGGNSNKIKNYIRKLEEDHKSWRLNHISINPVLLFLKPIRKVVQFLPKL